MPFSAYAAEAMLCLVSVTLCLLTGIILLLFSGKNKPAVYLGFYYIAFGYAIVVAGFTYSRLLSYAPHLYRTGNLCWLLCMPLSWLYIRTQVTNKPLTGWDTLHLLPLVLYFIDYCPFFFSSVANKEQVIRTDLGNLDGLLYYRQGWFLPQNSQIPLRVAQTIFYWILQVRLLTSAKAAGFRKNRFWRRWMILFNVLQIPMFLPALVVLSTGIRAYFWATTVPPVTGALLSSLALFLYPRILYGLGKAKSPLPVRAKTAVAGPAVQRLTSTLEKVMKDQKPFLDPDYTLRQLADTIDIPLYKLSAYFNQVQGVNFSDYLNQWRIRYCLELMREKEVTNLNLHGIATRCGFNNRNTFSSAFKKVTGQLPSAYINSNN